MELPGNDHVGYGTGSDLMLDEMEEFLTGTRAPAPEEFDRVLATVMFTDLVGSTEMAASMGDRSWGDRMAQHNERSGASSSATGDARSRPWATAS